MEWLAEDIERGERLLLLSALLVGGLIVWGGRKRLSAAIPVAVVFLVLAAIAIPSFIPARYTAQRNACINNLRQIHEAKVRWADLNGKTHLDTPTELDLFGTKGTNGLLRKPLTCPRGGTYTLGNMNEPPSCSFAHKRHRLDGTEAGQ